MRLIDADVFEAISWKGTEGRPDTFDEGVRWLAEQIDKAPTAERRGHWKECKSAIPIPMEKLHIADGIMFCSECEHLALQKLVYEDGNGDLRFIKSNYCPNCGAIMEE